jgi:glycerol-3-phosphate dehydrogenase (NAD(P)+)
MSEILRQETCGLKIGVLSGPNLAAELLKGHPSGSVIASRYDEVVERTQRLFRGSFLRVYGGRDVVGTEVAGSFKNIVAIAAGVTDGLGFGDNAKSLVITRGLSEMATLGARLGADVLTFGGLAGVGDLMATCASPLSRNHQTGEKLASGMSVDEALASLSGVAEGVPTSSAVYRKAKALRLDLPLANAVFQLVHEHRKAPQLLVELMSLPVTDEFSQLRY